ncbi:MAG TPA: DUF2330 domain-containing protein [Nostocaceae cyanobacterium]|nr:DUF2330 domain-containing protein [Nostocaceae cyanobacterium]
MKYFRLIVSGLLTVILTLCFTPTAWAFCGFYVAKADSKLYNKASQVVIARDGDGGTPTFGDRTVLTMANDYQGDVKDFAVVVPVPTVIKAQQVRVAEPKVIERLDAFSAPRLVEYFDRDPCSPPSRRRSGLVFRSGKIRPSVNRGDLESDRSLGVTVEAQFNAGEYEIVILSAKESGGLETWLNRNGYKIPKGAKDLLKPYIRSGMKFFVAKVNLEKFEQSGYQFLRPLQIAYQSPKFVLPIRLGMINANSEQDLIVYILSPKGQAEVTNYRTVKVPSNIDIPIFVKNEFGYFYKSMFQTSYTKEDKKVAFLEYAWNMSSCDPCSADPLNQQELKEAGVFWLDNNPQTFSRSRDRADGVFITRLHVRYTRNKFPEDLILQETSNQESFQGRYILRHPFTGELKCDAGIQYKQSLAARFEQEAQNLASLTNWKIQDIRKRIKLTVGYLTPTWWENVTAWLRFW